MRQSSANLKALRDVCNVCFIIIVCILIYCFPRDVHKVQSGVLLECMIQEGAAGNPVGNFQDALPCVVRQSYAIIY